jgi:predicted RND superfamily exporter protein
MHHTIQLEINLIDVPFIKKAIEERTEDLLEYIDTVAMLKTTQILKEMDEEIQDVEMDEFRADIRDMIEKHKPRKVGRPKGSKNAK